MAEHVPHPQGYERPLGATGPVRPVLSSIEDTGLNQVRTIGGTSAQGRCALTTWFLAGMVYARE